MKNQAIAAMRTIRDGHIKQANGLNMLIEVSVGLGRTASLSTQAYCMYSCRFQSEQCIQMHRHILQVVKDTPLALLPSLLEQTQKVTAGEGLASTPSPTKSGRATPVMVKKEDGGRKYVCPECQDEFGSQGGAQSHIVKRHGGSMFLCDYCDWSSSNPDSFKRHQLNCKKSTE